MLSPVFETRRNSGQELNQRLRTKLSNHQDGLKMRKQKLLDFVIRAAFVNDKVFRDGVPRNHGLEVVPGTSEEPINLGASATGRVTVKPA